MNPQLLDFNNIISYLTYPPFPKTLLVLKVLFISIFLYFLFTIINYLLFKTHYFQWLYGESLVEAFAKRTYGIKKLDVIWSKLKERGGPDLESDYKLAVIEADSLLDRTLASIGYKGESLEERLNQITLAHLSTLEEIKTAHKVRNDIVRDPDYRLNVEKAKEILSIYKKTFEELEVF